MASLGISFGPPSDDDTTTATKDEEQVTLDNDDRDPDSDDPESDDPDSDDPESSDDDDQDDNNDNNDTGISFGISFSSKPEDADADADADSDEDPDADSEEEDSSSYELDSDSEDLHVVLKYGVHGKKGRRKTMEDSHLIALQAACDDGGEPTPSVGFFSVFDGHGGDECALYCSERMFPVLLSHMPELPGRNEMAELDDLETALRESYVEVEKEFIAMAEKKNLDPGSTAVSALIHGNKLVVANVGDSEAVLSRAGKAVNLTVIHNPAKNPAEGERIEAMGGRIYKNRVALHNVPPQLCSIAVSRAFGDVIFKHTPSGELSGLTADPDSTGLLIEPSDEFLILACDGVWDVMTHDDALTLVSDDLAANGFDPQHAVEELVEAAYRAGSTDNITALVVLFDWVPLEDLEKGLSASDPPLLVLDVNGEDPSDELMAKVAAVAEEGNAFAPVIDYSSITGTVKLMPRSADGPSTPTSGGGSGISFGSAGDDGGDDDDNGDENTGFSSDSDSDSDEYEKVLWPGKIAEYTDEEPANGAMRNIPGTPRGSLFAWRNREADDQVGHLEVQQYLQQLIRTDPADIATLVETPPGVQPIVWMYEHLRQLTLELSHLAVMLEECGCNPESCPKMKATAEWMFLCAAHKETQECSAIDYICHTLDGAAALLNSNKYFPSRVNMSEADSKANLQSVARRLYRINAHAYFNHADLFEEYEDETHVTERFMALAAKYKLVGRKMRIIPPVSEW